MNVETLRAALWMIGAIIAFTAMAVAGRAASLALDTFEIMLFRSCVGLLIVLSCATYSGNLSNLITARPLLHLWRNLWHFTGQNLWFFAITVAPLAQVFALEFTTPVWVLLLAPLVLKETLTRRQIGLAAFSFLGVIMVARPDLSNVSWGIVAAGLAAIAFALTALATRVLTQTEPILRILFYLTLMQLVFGAVCAGIDGDITWPDHSNIIWVIIIGIAGLAAHFCLTTALSIAPASVVMPIDFARLPVIVVIGAAFYDEPFDLWIIIGAMMIFGANYANVRETK